MAKDDGGADDRGDVALAVSKLFSQLTGKQLWVVILVAWLSGGSSGVFTKAPDRYTGEDHKEYAEKVDTRFRALETRQTLDDRHRVESVGGFERIRACEKQISTIEHDCERVEDDIKLLRGNGY